MKRKSGKLTRKTEAVCIINNRRSSCRNRTQQRQSWKNREHPHRIMALQVFL